MRLLPFLLPIFLLASCHTVRSVEQSSAASDSLVTRMRDSIRFVINRMETDYEKRVHDITSSGVTFSTPCPDLSTIRASLDSVGRINFDNAVLRDSLRSLHNQVSIDKHGAIVASGAISAAYRTNSMIVEENTRLATTNDSLWAVHDSDMNRLQRTKSETITIVKHSTPGWVWWLLGVACALCFAAGWRLRR